MIQVRLILRPLTDLSHVGPEDFLSATLSEDEFQGIFKPNFGWLASAKHKVARNLHSTLSSLLLYPARLKEPVWSLELPHRREAWHPVCVCSRSDRTSTRRPSWDCSARAFWRLPSSSSGIFHFWSTHILIMTIVRPLLPTRTSLYLPLLLQFYHDCLAGSGCHDWFALSVKV